MNPKLLHSIAIVLLLTTSALLASIPATNAQQVSATYPTFSYLTVTPQPSGVSQTVNVIFWLDKAPPLINSVDYYGWNFTVSITKPDGKTETKGPFETDSLGGSWCLYTPNQLGTYKFKAIFGGATITLSGPANPFMGLQPGTYLFQPSESQEVELTVQTDKVEAWPETPLPADYWSNPISAENREWSKIAGNWLASTGFASTTPAPDSAHILWTKPMSLGGIASGDLGWGMNFYNGMLYEPKFTPPVIISGRIFYNIFPQGGFSGNAQPGVACIDLRTGEEIWRDETMPQISCGQTYDFEGQDGYGVRAYLWAASGSSLLMYDAFSGRLITTIANVSGMFGFFGFAPNYGPHGELLVYSLTGFLNQLSLWNSSKCLIAPGAAQFSAQMWSPPVTVDYGNGMQWTVTIPAVAGGSPSLSFVDYADDVIVAEATITATMNGTNPTFVDIGYSTKTGAQLWTQTRTGYGWGFSGPAMPGLMGMKSAYGEGVYAIFHKETMQWHAFNVKTGEALWSTESLNQYTNNDYSMYDWSGQIAYGKLYTTGYSGCVVAFDLQSGTHLWTYDQGSSGLMTPFGSWPIINGIIVADGKIYIPTQEHTPNTPMFRGYRVICINATSGKEIWSVPGFFASWAISADIMIGYSGYDNQAYAIGKGNSATTVTATAGLGNAITIQGTVTDQSPGKTAKGIPAAGTPCISDDNMTAWMAYLYEQQPMPSNVMGVKVNVLVVDPNGNSEEIGTVSSDMSGNFATLFTPKLQGLYTIVATFAGTNSYYSSYAETHIAVGASPSAAPIVTATPTPTPTPTATQPTVTPTISPSPAPNPEFGLATEVYVGIAAVVIIAVIAVIALILRKRK